MTCSSLDCETMDTLLTAYETADAAYAGACARGDDEEIAAALATRDDAAEAIDEHRSEHRQPAAAH